MTADTTAITPAFLDTGRGHRLAYHRLAASGYGTDLPGVVFLGGFRSDMTGSKAMALEAHCRARGQAFVRFDYFAHGQSDGAFVDGTIGGWAADAVAVLDHLTAGPQILIGSSMGGWIMLLAALQRPARIAGLIGIAAAPDFTQELLWQQLDGQARETLMRSGVLYQETPYDPEPYAISRALIEDGAQHCLLSGPIGIAVPVRLLQGMRDDDVPWRHALRLAEALATPDVRTTLIKNGDHRLSEPDQLALLMATLDGLSGA